MKSFIIIAASLLSTLAFAPQAQAGEGGSCHFHGNKPVSEAAVIDCANQRRDSLVKSGKLENSWSKVQHSKMEQIDGSKGKEWKLTYQNAAATDKVKQNLYMFYALAGHFIAANHTGK